MEKTPLHLKRNKNVLYTGFGDDGSTTLFDCKQTRISKSANLIEALGSVDELNAFLGLIKTYPESNTIHFRSGMKKVSLSFLLEEIQQNLFVIQAELGGSKMTIKKRDLLKVEKYIERIAEIMPPIKSFTISGGSVVSSSTDYARTLARKSERRVISVYEEKRRGVSRETLAYLNRLSSFLFSLSRFANYSLSITEKHPTYNKK